MEELESRLLLSAAPIATHNFSIYHRTGATQSSGSGSMVGLTAAQIRQAYGINQAAFGSITGDGSGQTIAIVDAYNDPNIVSDLAAFDAAMHLAAPPKFTVVGQSGTSTLPGTDPAGKGNSWAVEIALDVEWAHAVAPGANILLVEASSASLSNLFTAINTARNYAGVSVVSMSWGASEWSGEASYDSYFTTPAGGHTGVTFVASSGDSGGVVTYPSASPNVLSVGGTTLSIGTGGSYISERGWSGSGGGISRYETQPAYQKVVVTQSTTYRATPDVAMDADPNSGVAVYDSWDFGSSTPWVQIGGTSLSTPMWAGVIAIADQGSVLAGQGTLGGQNALTKIYALPSSDFHDITSGNNGYAAGQGYDLVTGRGTPIVNLLVADLAGPTKPVPTIGSLTTSPTSGLAGTGVTLTASNVQESSGSATISAVKFYLESNSTLGLQVGGDTSLGTGTQNGTTWTCSFDTTGLSGGTYTFYATATDSNSVTGAVVSTTFQVTLPAPANDNFANAVAITGTSATLTGSNVNATREAGEPNIAGNIGGASVWWSWKATQNAKVSLDTHGSSFDTMLGVYTGSSVSTLKLVASNDDTSRSNLTSSLTFKAVIGTTYYFAVDGYNSGYGAATGGVILHLSEALAPANSKFANAAILTGAAVAWAGANVGATTEAGAPRIAGAPGGASIWFAWTPTTSGIVNLNTHGSNFDTLLGVYTGSVVSSLTTIAANDDTGRGDLTSSVTFNATAHTTYYFDVDGYAGAMGNVALNLSQTAGQTASQPSQGPSNPWGGGQGNQWDPWFYGW
jgi:hypothetical protein